MDVQQNFTTALPDHSPESGLISRSFITLGILLFVLRYLNTWYKFRCTDRFKALGSFESQSIAQIPPQYPSFIPFLGSFLAFAWDTKRFIRNAAVQDGKGAAARVAVLPGVSLYFFQDREAIKRLFKHPDVASPVPIYLFALEHLFDMPKRAIKVYQKDDSGLGLKPRSTSDVTAGARAFHICRKGLSQGLTGSGLGPATGRYTKALIRNINTYENENMLSSTEWSHIPNIYHFIYKTVGAAMVESHFGPALLRLNPNYMEDLRKYDDGMPWFVRKVPRFIVPEIYKARENILKSLTEWYKYARQNFDESQIEEDGDGDPIWGSQLSRLRQDVLHEIDEHDDRTIASLDLGHSLGIASNVVAAAMMTIYHVFHDPELLSRVRASVTSTLGITRVTGLASEQLNAKLLTNNDLMCSIYAEILRLHGMSHFLVSAPKTSDVDVGRWILPRGAVGLLNAGISHMDSEFWNTQNGKHPVTEFWAERFIVDPKDPDSGPINPAVRQKPYSRGEEEHVANENADRPFFSTDGTEGVWFPYGGGGGICLGRFLAKNALLIVLAYLVLEYEMEPLVDKMVVDPWRYGLAVDHPKHPTAFRIRRRL